MTKRNNAKRKSYHRIKYFFILLFIFYLLIRFMPIVSSSNNDTSIAEYGNITVINQLNCYIIRSEQIINSVAEGTVKYLVHQGEKVEKGYNVVEISKDVLDDSTRKKLEVINQRIENLNIDENNLFINDVEKLNQEVETIINNIKDYNEKNDLLKVESLRTELNNKLQKKRVISGDKSFAGKNMEELKNEQMQLEQKINDSVGYIKSPEPGIVSYFIDGYENILNPENIEVLELDKLTSIEAQPLDLRSEKVIHNQPIFKIIDNHQWHVISWVPKEDSEIYKVGREVVFKLSDGEIKGAVFNKIENSDSDLIIFKTNEFSKDFLLYRNLNIEVVAVNYEGLKLYTDSIIEKDGRKGVYVLDLNRNAVFKPVKIIGYNEEFVIVRSNVFFENKDGVTTTIDTIKLYDEIVRDAERVKEGQIVF